MTTMRHFVQKYFDSFKRKESKYFWTKCLIAVVYERIFFVLFERWEPFLASNSIRLSRRTVLLSAILSASAYSAILFRYSVFRYSVFRVLKTPYCTYIANNCNYNH